jgi:uncharacterized protein YndB with AHSA1/START domain
VGAVADQSIEISAPIDRVWELVSTGEGLSSWFVDAAVDPGVSGSVTLRFGPGAEATVPIQVWQPPHRILFGATEPGGRTHDIQVNEAAAGGVVVRLIDSGVGERELDAVRHGWKAMLDVLKGHAEKG